jgi:predicted dinucleotide-binding enzyme
MNIAVLGTGMVGEAIASRLVALGHDVTMGSRDAQHPRALAWAGRAGPRARVASFADAAAFGALVFNCTHGAASLDVLQAAGSQNLAHKILIDVANRLPPDPSGAASLGEQIQRAFPETRVVKTLNTLNCELMANPALLPGLHSLFLSGDDPSAKAEVRSLLETFGWRDVIDLGGIETARASETLLSTWLALYRALGTARFNFAVVR